MKGKFLLSLGFGALWLAVSVYFSVFWAQEASCALPQWYVWWTIIGIALLPGFLMSAMFFSNLIHWRLRSYPDTDRETTILMCAHNEETAISQAIRAVLEQDYQGMIRLLVIDNASEDGTREEVLNMQRLAGEKRKVEYLYCPQLGKANALNCGLAQVHTPFFLTVDADTCLEKQAVRRMMNHITAASSVCVAGNLFVRNARVSLATRMQNYDYLLSIAAVKRFQGSYHSTLVAQGAFSAYRTEVVRETGGWQNVLGEDIVLTYALLQQGLVSSYEPAAVGYTEVPQTCNGLYNQRKRWAIGMLEGLSSVPPWRQGSAYSRYFTWVNLWVIYLDLAFLFGLLPGVLLALCGYYYLAGCLTLFTLAVSVVLFLSTYLYQKKLKIPFQKDLLGFLLFLFLFQAVQSTAALQGYLTWLVHGKEEWG